MLAVARFAIWTGVLSVVVAVGALAWIVGMDAVGVSIPVGAASGLAVPGAVLVVVARRLTGRPRLEAVIEMDATPPGGK